MNSLAYLCVYLWFLLVLVDSRSNFDWSAIQTTSQLQNVNPNQFVTITEGEFLELISQRGFICQGFTADQLSNISTEIFTTIKDVCLEYISAACKGISAEKVAKLPVSQFYFFSINCLASLPSNCFSYTSSEQITKLNEDNCQGITEEQLEGMNIDSYNGFRHNGGCFYSIEITDHGKKCKAINSKAFGTFDGSVLDVLEPNCMENIPAESFSPMSAKMLALFHGELCKAFSAAMIEYIPSDAFAGITTDCSKNINYMACGGFSADDIRNMPLESFESFSQLCFEHLRKDMFDSFTQDDTMKWKKTICEKIQGIQISHMSPKAYSGFTKDCTSAFSKNFPTDACEMLLPDGFINFSPSALDGVGENCGSHLPVDILSSITPEFAANLPKIICRNLSYDQISRAPNDILRNFNTNCFSGFGDICSGFSADDILGLNSQQIGALQPTCIKNLSNVIFSKATKLFMESLSIAGYEAITPMQLKSIKSPDAISSIRSEGVKNWTTVCDGITGDLLSNFSDEVMYALSDKCISAIEPCTTETFLDDPSRLSPNGFLGTCEGGQANSCGLQVYPLVYWLINNPDLSFTLSQNQTIKLQDPSARCMHQLSNCFAEGHVKPLVTTELPPTESLTNLRIMFLADELFASERNVEQILGSDGKYGQLAGLREGQAHYISRYTGHS
eukprot:TRINITY_DN4655_c0_g4_i3.p1 TRINITY_DN4655_c0_g4~~TRINITY_DN4655_c0_g4_i3.p1  ORF type:complete len:675 (-),score=120.13 TRINITY_DN4655_c0_g4_i3:727-2751(-)